MDLIRVGDKLVNLTKIDETVRRILQMRSEGMSQQEVAIKLQLDRAFISRLESMGSIRRGGRIGLIAFPAANNDELAALADRYGIEKRLILSDKERWGLMEGKNGIDFFNQIIEVIGSFGQCDTVLVFCSAKWNRLAQALLDCEVIALEIGSTPITGDIYIDPKEVEKMLKTVSGKLLSGEGNQ